MNQHEASVQTNLRFHEKAKSSDRQIHSFFFTKEHTVYVQNLEIIKKLLAASHVTVHYVFFLEP